MIFERLRPDDRGFLRELAVLAGRARTALVGGAVRDALLAKTPLDLDVVVEGASVEGLARRSGLPFVYHPRYDNATLTLPDGRHLDLIHARRETYAHPGASPDPRPGTLEEDLARRDFTVNAVAFELGREAVLDSFGGVEDLEEKCLRPLHAGSFRDDASRIVRGARLAARLNFDLAPEGRAQVEDAVAFAPITPRVKLELPLVFDEPFPGEVLVRLRAWGAASVLGRDASPALRRLDEVRRARGEARVPPLVYAAAWTAFQDQETWEAWDLGERPRKLLRRAREDRVFPDDAPESLLRLALQVPPPAPRVTGAELLALGVPPGPLVGRVLAHLAELRRAGDVANKDDELRAASVYLTRHT